MKTLGLIGGMSFESTVDYYKIINETVKNTLGGLCSAKILLYSVDFSEIEEYQRMCKWSKCGDILAEIALKLEKAGADYIVICTNTMHKVVAQIENKISIPIIHIASATAFELKKNNIKKTALLGTKYTMCEDFYKDKLIKEGLEVIIPQDDEIEIVNDVIYSELCQGKILKSSREKFIKIINNLKNRGAQGVVLGCTEIGMLIRQEDVDIKVFDTTIIHARQSALKAMDYC